MEQLLLKNVTAPGPLQEFRAAQAAAIEALAKSMGPMRSTAEVVALLLKDVSLKSESFAHRVDAICASVASPPRGTRAATPISATEFISRVVQALHEESQVKVGDIVGQILWRHRKAEVLKDRRFKKVAESVEWAVADDLITSPEMVQLVEGVFRDMTAAEGGRMSAQVWRKTAKIIQENPVLNSRLRRTDADRLYYAETRSRGEANSGGINRREFKSLLVQLAFCMEVPPYMVLLAVGSHNGQVESKAENADKETQ